MDSLTNSNSLIHHTSWRCFAPTPAPYCTSLRQSFILVHIGNTYHYTHRGPGDRGFLPQDEKFMPSTAGDKMLFSSCGSFIVTPGRWVLWVFTKFLMGRHSLHKNVHCNICTRQRCFLCQGLPKSYLLCFFFSHLNDSSSWAPTQLYNLMITLCRLITATPSSTCLISSPNRTLQLHVTLG